ncbi:MAG: TonB family protein [Candidatus Binatia bacterium]
MDLRRRSPSPLEVVLARMRKREEGPWGRIQMLGHQWLTRIERTRLIRSYNSLLRGPRQAFGFRSKPAIDTDSLFFFSLLFHLLLMFLLSWITFSSRPLYKPGPIRVRMLDFGKGSQGEKEQRRKEPKKPTPSASAKSSPPPKVVVQKPASKPPKMASLPKKVAPLPAPKVLAESPKEDAASLTAESAEALIRLPTQQSGAIQTPQVTADTTAEAIDATAPLVQAPDVPTLTDESVDDLIRLPASQSGAVQAPQLKVETAPLADVGKVSKDELKVPEGLLRGGAFSPSEARPSAFSHPDFGPYLDVIVKRVRSVWKYPEGSGTHVVRLRFVLDRGGRLARVEVLDSANSKLDSSAIDAMKRASPFPPIPESLKDLAGQDLGITFKIQLGVKGVR